MGNSEEGKPSSEKSSPPAMDQSNIHVYPDWAALQAYYRPRVALPSYYNPTVASTHHPNPYMWGPAQAMMPPPYGTPYTAVYSHGGVFTHPAVPIGTSHTHSEAPTHSGNETLRVKIPGNQDQGLMKKLKGFDGLAMSIGNGNSDNGIGTDSPRSQSGETEGSSNGYDVVRVAAGERDPVVAKVGTTPEPIHHHHHHHHQKLQQQQQQQQRPSAVPPSDDRDMKRERRKQSNRESARRSRLRKQAETEELALRVESLGAENAALKSEITRLTDSSAKLRLQNAHLLGKLASQGDLSGVGNWRRSGDGVAGSEDDDPSSVAKLHQLLDASSRADAVAAG